VGSGINIRDLGRYLMQHPGNAAVRGLREDLMQKGIPLDRISQAKERAYTPVDTSLPPDEWLSKYMNGIARSDQFDLATAPEWIAGALGMYLARAADADGNVSGEAIREKLGPRAQKLFEMAADRMHAQLWETSASRALPKVPANLRGSVSEDPHAYRLTLNGEVLREMQHGAKPGLMRLADPRQTQRVLDEQAARLRRRNPVRRIAAELGNKLEVPKMPALEELRGQAAKTKPLKGAQLFVVQHLYASTKAILDAAVDAGVKPDDVTVMGKPYSGSMKVAAAMVDSGYNVVAPSLGQSEYDDNDAHMDKLIAAELPRLIASGGSGPICVVDDGGAVASWVQKNCDAATQKRFKFVEQTQRGANMVREHGVKMPVIDVAESDAKKNWESPSIGHSVYLETKRALDKLRAQGCTIEPQMAILGFGSIGSHTAAQFSALPEAERPKIYVYDPDPEKQKAAAAAGYTVCATKEEALRHGSVTVSATGRDALSLKDYRVLPKAAVMVNAASSNSELNARNALSLEAMSGNSINGTPFVNGQNIAYGMEQMSRLDTAVLDEDDVLWDTFEGHDVKMGKDVSATQTDRVVHTADDQDVYFVHSGFVVNLTDDVDPIPPRYIGLTRSLLFAALLQSVNATGEGLVPLDDAKQKRIVEVTEGELKKTGESLLNPTFS
jgi:S-adenosylhomocysteine hydrolase